jgi:hypothetical protein
MALTLNEALERVSTTGADADCFVTPEAAPLPTGVFAVNAMLAASKDTTAKRFTVKRTMRNWAILRDGVEVIRKHPWDNRPNECRLASRSGTLDSKIGTSLHEDACALSSKFEGLGMLMEAQLMRRLALALATRFGLPSLEQDRDTLAEVVRRLTQARG